MKQGCGCTVKKQEHRIAYNFLTVRLFVSLACVVTRMLVCVFLISVCVTFDLLVWLN